MSKEKKETKSVLDLRAENMRYAKHCAIKHLSFVSKTNLQECIEKLATANLQDYVKILTESLIITSGVLHKLASEDVFTLEDLLEMLIYLREARSKVARVILDIKDIAKKLEKTQHKGVEIALLDELLYVNGNIYASQLHILELVYKIVQKMVLGE